jgi:hypothetical protein
MKKASHYHGSFAGNQKGSLRAAGIRWTCSSGQLRQERVRRRTRGVAITRQQCVDQQDPLQKVLDGE